MNLLYYTNVYCDKLHKQQDNVCKTFRRFFNFEQYKEDTPTMTDVSSCNFIFSQYIVIRFLKLRLNRSNLTISE